MTVYTKTEIKKVVNQNGYLGNLLVFQYSLSPARNLFKYMDGVNWTFGKKKC